MFCGYLLQFQATIIVMASAHKPQPQVEDKTPSQDQVAQLIANFTREKIVPTFRGLKRWTGKQFAVINFWSEHNCATGLQAVQFTPEPELDPTKVSVPQTLSEDISCNYIVARPRRSTAPYTMLYKSMLTIKLNIFWSRRCLFYCIILLIYFTIKTLELCALC